MCSSDLGFECGICVADWQDIKVGDQFEVFEMVEVARKLHDTNEKKDKSSEK